MTNDASSLFALLHHLQGTAKGMDGSSLFALVRIGAVQPVTCSFYALKLSWCLKFARISGLVL